MPQFIVSVPDPDTGVLRFAKWSTVVDAPVSPFLTRDVFTACYPQDAEPDRLDRAARKGTSSHIHDSAEDLMRSNRAGENETNLPIPEIVRLYREETS